MLSIWAYFSRLLYVIFIYVSVFWAIITVLLIFKKLIYLNIFTWKETYGQSTPSIKA
jgi:hypothetical protein